MVSWRELKARTKQFFSFSRYELQGLVVAVLVTGFIFSFRDWGTDSFDLLYGLKNLALAVLAAGISFFGHIAPQKLYGLTCGYKVEFRTWWIGIIIALVLAFVSGGYLTLVLAGGVGMSLMVRHRLGQFRYGHLMEEQAITGLWGMLGSMIFAGLFRIFNLIFPSVLFFERGLMISLIFAVCSVLPLPSLDGLTIFFGSRATYFVGIIAVITSSLLLLFGGVWGLVTGIIVGLIIGGWFILIGSEK